MILKYAVSFVGYVFLAWCLIVGALFFFQRSLLYFPDQQSAGDPQSYGLDTAEVVKIPVEEGIELTSWYIPPKTDKHPVMVLFHGNAGDIGDRAHKARFYHDFGMGVFLVEYRGYAGNPGKPTEKGLYADGKASIEYLIRKRQVSAQRLIIYGESLGTGTATEMMLFYDAAALVLETPFTSIGSVAQSLYPIVPVKFLLWDKFDNAKKIKKIQSPLLILHGTADETVPYVEGQRLYSTAIEPKELVSIEGGIHNNLYDFTQTGRSVIGFLKNHRILEPIPAETLDDATTSVD